MIKLKLLKNSSNNNKIMNKAEFRELIEEIYFEVLTEKKATHCGRCGHTHVKGTPCPRPFKEGLSPHGDDAYIKSVKKESHFKVGDKVKMSHGGTGVVKSLDKEHGADDEKYYGIELPSGKIHKHSPNELEKLDEGEMGIVKKTINAILKKNGIKKVESHSTSVRGFRRYSGSGYEHNYGGSLSLYKMPEETVKDIADQMKAAGVKVVTVYNNGFSYDPRDLDYDLLSLDTESVNEEEGNTVKPKDLPKDFLKSIEDKYGPIKDEDFFNKDLSTYFKTDLVNQETGGIRHKIIQLPSFENLFRNLSSAVDSTKELMHIDDIRKDEKARQVFEVVSKTFNALRHFLRTEYPGQYAMMKQRRSVNENKSLAELIKEEEPKEEPVKKPEVKTDEKPLEKAGEETVLETATDKMLGKFPSLKQAVESLLTNQYGEFVDEILWVAPRPSTFRVELKNKQNFILKWTGKGFEAQIQGKRYYINKLADFEQALDKLNELLKYGPNTGGEPGEGGEDAGDSGSSGGSGGGGDFPGGEGGGAEEEPAPEGDDAAAPAADLGGEDVEFQEPAEEPK
jgi:hypothetical protein